MKLVIAMRMRKGQAFETMMLVISVIVAIAILGILLGFIGGIGTFGANAKTVMPDLLKKVSQRGFGLEVKDKAEFAAGDQIYRADVVGESPVATSLVEFACTDTSICSSGSGTPLKVTSTSVSVNTKISAAIAVCKGSSNKYYVCMHSALDKASSDCAGSSKCKLT